MTPEECLLALAHGLVDEITEAKVALRLADELDEHDLVAPTAGSQAPAPAPGPSSDPAWDAFGGY